MSAAVSNTGARFDWRRAEARFNAYPQFTTTIDGRPSTSSTCGRPSPRAADHHTHGWPGPVVEYLDVIEPLSDPRAHGGDPADVFHLVVPSLPGYGLSGPTHQPGWDILGSPGPGRSSWPASATTGSAPPATTRLDDLPRARAVSTRTVIGVHVTQLFSFPSGDPTELDDLTDEDRRP